MIFSPRFLILPGLALAALIAAPAQAADFYKGKNVELTIGANPGGGYDGYARLTARYVAKHIPRYADHHSP